jgi:serine/threonine protein kinase
MSLEGLQLGRYQLLRMVGSGGMGEIYLADDPGIHRRVAIKVIRTEISSAPTVAGTGTTDNASYLSQREAKAVASLDHPYILPLYDYGEQQLQGATYTYLVMPYREDGSLADWIRQRVLAGGITALEVARIVQQAASALQYAHDHRVIHLDVKPSNFLLRYPGDKTQMPDVLLTDFGIAKLSTLTSGMSQSVRGTPAYMAPELWEGHPTPATDQYALAAMTYELMTGRQPFQGNPMQLMYAHVNTPPPPPSFVSPYLSPAIDAVLVRGLAKKAEERFPSVAAFDAALQQALRTISPSTQLSAPPADTLLSANVPNTPVLGTVRATLAISEEEARTGGRRDLTLPGDRRISVTIPPGVQNGQVLRIDDTQQTASGSFTSAVYLTLSVVQPSSSTNTPASLPGASDLSQVTHISEKIPPIIAEQQTLRQQAASADVQAAMLRPPHKTPLPGSLPPSVGEQLTLPSASMLEQTRLASNPAAPIPGSVPPVPKTPSLTSVGTLQSPPEKRRSPVRGCVALLSLLAIVLIAGSGGLYYYFALANHSLPQTVQGSANGTNNQATSGPGQSTPIPTQGTPVVTTTAQGGITPTATYSGASPSPTSTKHPKPTPTPRPSPSPSPTATPPTGPSLAISPASFSNGNNCGYGANHGWICSTALSNTGKQPINWAASSTGSPSVSFSPASGTLAAGATVNVTIMVGAMTVCPGNATFAFTDTASSSDTATAPWSCGTPTLTVTPTALDTTTCTSASGGWQCTVTLGDDVGGLNWSASSNVNATFSPASGTVYPSGPATVTITIPGCTSGTLSFTGPGNTVAVAWTCLAATPTPAGG